ncbi:hypothetical protein HETIRDRAFT_101165 [Heterobasidion irregulare TC 32-1]|uniref:Uncharacterized protein n=1 Tax=Heterobasidion irregulare (strain TC 32-1) TaxID=747525 RepID=W4KGS9_HETIT|nr:uncharacterized protein HETIRDRAFT_101165 [Heterobasidion irregulare TC 32-1]ETW85052.1 hypothetical protein HETIRDRAFT_101165 [Heterobasidion irregulare TC 32-1]
MSQTLSAVHRGIAEIRVLHLGKGIFTHQRRLDSHKGPESVGINVSTYKRRAKSTELNGRNKTTATSTAMTLVTTCIAFERMEHTHLASTMANLWKTSWRLYQQYGKELLDLAVHAGHWTDQQRRGHGSDDGRRRSKGTRSQPGRTRAGLQLETWGRVNIRTRAEEAISRGISNWDTQAEEPLEANLSITR